MAGASSVSVPEVLPASLIVLVYTHNQCIVLDQVMDSGDGWLEKLNRRNPCVGRDLSVSCSCGHRNLCVMMKPQWNTHTCLYTQTHASLKWNLQQLLFLYNLLGMEVSKSVDKKKDVQCKRSQECTEKETYKKWGTSKAQNKMLDFNHCIQGNHTQWAGENTFMQWAGYSGGRDEQVLRIPWVEQGPTSLQWWHFLLSLSAFMYNPVKWSRGS